MTRFLGSYPLVVVLVVVSPGCSGGGDSPNVVEGPPGPIGPQGPRGLTGAQGPQGADGSLRIYGDGSAGNLDITADTDWSTFGADVPTNLQFASVNVAAGVTFKIPSGVTFRCTGDFVVDGTITVETYAPPGDWFWSSAESQRSTPQEPGAGVNGNAAGNGQYITTTSTLALGGARGSTARSVGFGLGQSTAVVVRFGPIGGGGGGSSMNRGGSGGGTLTVLAAGGITVGATGAIHADGEDAPFSSTALWVSGGGGGGGGGALVFASATNVAISGDVTADGGDGADAGNNPSASMNAAFGRGGGGGGGVIHLLAPVVDDGTGFLSTAGGVHGGAPSPSTTMLSLRVGGGGGGAGAGGAGERGYSVLANNTFFSPTGAFADAGKQVVHLLDPTSLF